LVEENGVGVAKAFQPARDRRRNRATRFNRHFRRATDNTTL
jgi:hypothetical protein